MRDNYRAEIYAESNRRPNKKYAFNGYLYIVGQSEPLSKYTIPYLGNNKPKSKGPRNRNDQ